MRSGVDIIVIGAGAAGLAAAKEATQHGARVLVLEGRDRIGGRIHTLASPSAPFATELGAEFVHGRPDSTWGLIRNLELSAYDVPFEHHERRHGRLAKADDFDARLEDAMRGLAKLRGPDVSFSNYLTRSRVSELKRSTALDFVKGFDAADPERISARSLAKEWADIGNTEDNTQFRLLTGYGALVAGLLRSIDRRLLKLRLREQVTGVHWKPGEAAIHTRRRVYRAPRVVITLPLGILQCPPGGPGAVHFDPPVPALRRVHDIGFGGVVKVLLEFDRPFWEDDEDTADASFLHTPGSAFPTWWTARPLRSCRLTGWAGGPVADALGNADESRLRRCAIQSLADLFHRARGFLGARLCRFYAHNWLTDPFSRGAYSYALVGQDTAASELARPVAGTLCFAGEALDTENPATVAGALTSGKRAGHWAAR